jgi:hypothetical protein
MKYLSSSIEELKNGLFKVSLTYSGFLYGSYTEHESFKTINDCKGWLIEKRCPELDIKYIANLPEGIPCAPKLPKLYKDIIKK